MGLERLEVENRHFHGNSGTSQHNRACAFLPAFLDSRDGVVYLSRFGDGRLAPMHLFDGLPETLVIRRSAAGKVTAVRNSVVAGFVRAGRFYTRAQAAQAVARLASLNSTHR